MSARPDSPSRPDLEGLKVLLAADAREQDDIRYYGGPKSTWAPCHDALVDTVLASLPSLIAHVERLEKALKPFADEAEEYDYGDGSGPDLKDAPDASSLREISNLTVGDLRFARATLSQGTSHE